MKKDRPKKTNKAIWLLVLLVALGIAAVVFGVLSTRGGKVLYEVGEYKVYKSDFDEVKKSLTQVNQSQQVDAKQLVIQYYKDKTTAHEMNISIANNDVIERRGVVVPQDNDKTAAADSTRLKTQDAGYMIAYSQIFNRSVSYALYGGTLAQIYNFPFQSQPMSPLMSVENAKQNANTAQQRVKDNQSIDDISRETASYNGMLVTRFFVTESDGVLDQSGNPQSYGGVLPVGINEFLKKQGDFVGVTDVQQADGSYYFVRIISHQKKTINDYSDLQKNQDNIRVINHEN